MASGDGPTMIPVGFRMLVAKTLTYPISTFVALCDHNPPTLQTDRWMLIRHLAITKRCCHDGLSLFTSAGRRIGSVLCGNAPLGLVKDKSTGRFGSGGLNRPKTSLHGHPRDFHKTDENFLGTPPQIHSVIS